VSSPQSNLPGAQGRGVQGRGAQGRGVQGRGAQGPGAQGRGAALLLLDLMPVVTPAFGGDDALLARLAGAAKAARAAGVQVIHVRVAFRDGYPEVAPANKVFSAVTAVYDFTESSPGTAPHPALEVEPGDILVTKRRVSAFAGSDLDLVLRSGAIHTLVLAGVTTSGVVLSTLRQAADLDYRIVVLADGCADAEQHVHDVLIDSVFPAHADVVSIDAWTAAVTAGHPTAGGTS
jgi:nicotinamidase-related amidase